MERCKINELVFYIQAKWQKFIKCETLLDYITQKYRNLLSENVFPKCNILCLSLDTPTRFIQPPHMEQICLYEYRICPESITLTSSLPASTDNKKRFHWKSYHIQSSMTAILWDFLLLAGHQLPCDHSPTKHVDIAWNILSSEPRWTNPNPATRSICSRIRHISYAADNQ